MMPEQSTTKVSKITSLSLLSLALFSLSALTACGPSYPNCDQDEDCHQGEFCVNGQCQMCRTDEDCQAGQSCVDGRCDAIPGYCGSSADCPAGQECQGNRCVATQSEQPAPTPTPTETPAQPTACTIGPVYFDFESAELSSAVRDQLQAIAACMRERNVQHLSLVGHCDERGTEEYNLALGDRRARAVRDFLVSLGVARNAIGATSQGEEMASGHDESGWSRDRRTDVLEQ